jgi:uncharacterized protein (TIGR03086 family)
MSEIAQRYKTIADGFTARVEGVAPDQWSSPTPCTDWTVRDILVHVVETHWRMLALVDGTGPAEVDLDGDLAQQWRAARDAVTEALGDPARATTVVRGLLGEQPFEALVGGLLCGDTLIHTWDIARATGQDERLDPGAVTACMAFLAPLDERMRRPGGFSAKITPAPDADEQTRLLNFCGRVV